MHYHDVFVCMTCVTYVDIGCMLRMNTSHMCVCVCGKLVIVVACIVSVDVCC